MKLKILLLATLLVVTYAALNADTPNILIGKWIAQQTKAQSGSTCCQPTGNLVITDNGNNTITLTSTSWVGNICGGRDSSFQDLIYVNGGYSYNQLKSNSPASFLPILNDASFAKISVSLGFSSSSTSMSLVYNLDAVDECYTFFSKSAQVVSVFAAIWILCMSLII